MFVKAGSGPEIVRKEETPAGHQYGCSAVSAARTSVSSRCWSPSTTAPRSFHFFQHTGIDILYMLSGVMEYG